MDSLMAPGTFLFEAWQARASLASGLGVTLLSSAFSIVIATVCGIAMGVAGRTAPGSGMEHTVSHLLEMAAQRRGAETALRRRPIERHALTGPFRERRAKGGNRLLEPGGAALTLAKHL